MKNCVDCKTDKDETEFWKKKDKRVAFCRDCGKIRNRKHREKNKEEANLKQKESYRKNRDKRIKSMKEDYQKNKEERLEYAKNKREQVKEDIKKNGLTLPDIKEKKCTSCKITKKIDEFYVEKTKNSFFLKCKICKIEEARQYRKENRAKINIYMRKYATTEAGTNRRMQTNLRKRLGEALKSADTGNTKLKNKLIGCSKEFLKKWFDYNLNLDNLKFEDYGPVWHIDHVIPCHAFDLDIEEQKNICFHWTNIRPLEKYKNLNKSNTILWPDIFVQEIRLRQFIKENHIDENVLEIWKNGALNTAVSEKFET